MNTRTILPKKTFQERPIATDDEQYQQLANDPSIPQFPQGTSYESSPFAGSTTFGTSSSRGFSTQGDFSPSNVYQASINMNQNTQPTAVLTGASPTNSASGADVLISHDKESADWINKRWRPLMAYNYMITCFVDFVIFPILWSMLQALSKGQVTSQWQPLTLQGAGLYHVAMGAILGIAAYGRTKEKLEGATKN